MTAQRIASDGSRHVLPGTWRRVLALSGVAFAVLFVVGFLLSGGDTPDYTAPGREWQNWADDNETNNRISAFLSLLAGFAFLHFLGAIRTALGSAEATARGSGSLARAAFAGGLTGIAGIIMAIVMIAAASIEGAGSYPMVSRAVITATAGPFLLASIGFAALLATAGLVTLRSDVFPRWTGILALIGALGFLVTFLTVLDEGNDDSVFGIGFPIGFLVLAIWSIVTSVVNYRRVDATTVAGDASGASSA